LIFGGAGFIGSNWASRLLQTSDARVHIFDNLSRRGVEKNLHWLREQTNNPERLKITVADVRDAVAVKRAMASATEVYHFAAQVAVTSSVTDPRHDFEVNALGTLNVLEAARQSGRQPFIDRKSTRLNSSHVSISYAVFCLKKKTTKKALRAPFSYRGVKGVFLIRLILERDFNYKFSFAFFPRNFGGAAIHSCGRSSADIFG